MNNITGFELQTSQWDGASYITTSKEGYKIVNFDEFAYNPARINIGSIGLFKDKIGIVSSLYVVFKITKDIMPEYLLILMKTKKFNKKILARQEGGVRSYFFYENFSKVKIYIPPKLDEQRKIVNFLDLINLKINLIEAKIDTLKKYKKGLIIYLLSNGIKTEKFANYIEYISKTSFASSDGKEKGNYPFYINSTDGNYKFTDSYTHEGKHLIVNTGGQAFIQISEEKFSAMADNLIIKIRNNLYGVYYYLKRIETRINYIGFQGTGIRHLDQNWLKRQYVILPPISDKKIESLEENTNNYIKILEIKLKKLHLIKMQLMKDLFI